MENYFECILVIIVNKFDGVCQVQVNGFVNMVIGQQQYGMSFVWLQGYFGIVDDDRYIGIIYFVFLVYCCYISVMVFFCSVYRFCSVFVDVLKKYGFIYINCLISDFLVVFISCIVFLVLVLQFLCSWM